MVGKGNNGNVSRIYARGIMAMQGGTTTNKEQWVSLFRLYSLFPNLPLFL
jgi:hypothetical protein